MERLPVVRRLLAGLALVCVMAMGCRPAPDADATLAPQADPQPADPRFELVSELSGVWSRPRRGGDVDDGAVYMLSHEVDHELLATRNGKALDMQNEAVDPVAGTATYHFRNQEPEQRLVFRRLSRDGGDPVLRVGWANGESEELTFVRPLADADHQAIVAAYEEGAVVIVTATAAPKGPATLVECGRAVDFRTRAICRDDALRAMDAALARGFQHAHDRGTDLASTLAAANRQLDACTSSDCLRQAHAQWIDYLADNYGTGERVR